MDGSHVSARADEGAAALPSVLAALDDAGVPVRAATVARPSLDDVYLRHAGRRFADADQQPATTASTGGAR
jgi:ABC-2 type transport system ATP-binding protein